MHIMHVCVGVRCIYIYTYVCIYIEERETGKDCFKYWMVRVLPNCVEKEAWRELEKNPKVTNF